MLHIPAVIDAARLAAVLAAIEAGVWVDGAVTAGHQSRRVKNNHQLAEGASAARDAGGLILAALEQNPTFVSAALPARVVPPLFNSHGIGEQYGAHIDGAVRQLENGVRLRTDLAATIFLSPPESYDGGELVVREPGGERRVKLEAGDMVLYSATRVHHVMPVTRGIRLAAFFWIQSLVKEETQRTALFELDRAIQALSADVPEHPALVELTGHYHNLIRMWSEL